MGNEAAKRCARSERFGLPVANAIHRRQHAGELGTTAEFEDELPFVIAPANKDAQLAARFQVYFQGLERGDKLLQIDANPGARCRCCRSRC